MVKVNEVCGIKCLLDIDVLKCLLERHTRVCIFM